MFDVSLVVSFCQLEQSRQEICRPSRIFLAGLGLARVFEVVMSGCFYRRKILETTTCRLLAGKKVAINKLQPPLSNDDETSFCGFPHCRTKRGIRKCPGSSLRVLLSKCYTNTGIWYVQDESHTRKCPGSSVRVLLICAGFESRRKEDQEELDGIATLRC